MAHTDYGTDTRIQQGSGGVAHTDYGTDTRIPKGVGEWLTRIMARIHGYNKGVGTDVA
ncbi:MAG: hypothetical protein SWX82_22690 [Cyanobacteriota bacterium]|nr:hypothetical protein [Cyanobacteriota bacterium]